MMPLTFITIVIAIVLGLAVHSAIYVPKNRRAL